MDQSVHAVRFNVNGLDVELKGDFDLGKNLNSVIKSETGFKVCTLAPMTLLVAINRSCYSCGHKYSLDRRAQNSLVQKVVVEPALCRWLLSTPKQVCQVRHRL